MENKAISKVEGNEVKFLVAGEEVKLNPTVVNQFIARGNQNLTNKEIGNFIQLCRYRKLNPFLNEAYPIKFGTEPAQLIVGADAFKRKAEENPNYEGYRAGVIVVRGKEVLELEGAFKLPQDQLIGGWCEVFVKGKKHPVVAKVSMSEYDKGKSTWKQIPCTMIRKVAVVQALREAFPTDLGAMYSGEELGVDEAQKNINVVHEEIIQNANKQEIDFEPDTEIVDAEVINSVDNVVDNVAKTNQKAGENAEFEPEW